MTEISLHILDIMQNSIAAGADRIVVQVEERRKEKVLIVSVRDNGKGMDIETTLKSSDPFYTSRKTRHVGMGIPLLKQHAEMSGGFFRIDSEKGKGTEVTAQFGLDHPDRQPLGDLAGTITMMMSANPGVDIVLKCLSDSGSFSIGQFEIREALGEASMQHNEVRTQITNLIINNIGAIEFSA